MKYSPECIKKLEAFTAEMTVTPASFWSHSSVHHIACLFGVCTRTVYNWRDANPAFLHAIKRWETKRNALFLEQRVKQGAWIFVAKNWLGMKDTQEIELPGGIAATIERVITDKRPTE